jgi:regulator of replication initiation timing
MTLEQEVKQLRELVQQLQAEVGRLQAENAQLRAENEQLRAENAKLRARLEKAEGKKGDPPPFVRANRPQKEKGPRKKRDSKHNQARKLERPTRVEKHALTTCPDCDEALVGGSLHYRRQVIEIPEPQPVEIVEHQIEKRWCSRCRRWHWPEMEWQGVVMGQGRIGVRLAGMVGYLRAVLRVTIRVIQQYLETVHRIRLSIGEISALCRRVTEALAEAGEQLRAEARASPVVHMDETGWREDGQNGYIWCLVAEAPQPVRYYEYHKSRAWKVAKGMLGTFKGHLVSDFYSAYNQYAGAHQRCWPHLLGDLHDLGEKQAGDTEVEAWVLAVKTQYRRAQEANERAQTAQDRQILYELLVAATRALALPYAQAEHPCRPLAKRLLRHENELFQFVLHPHVPADNNLAERALRPLVVQRKISGGSRSAQGSKTRMALASLFETWKARQLNPLVQCWRELGLSAEPVPAPL